MANAFYKAASFKVIFVNGVDEEMNPIYKSKTFQNISKEASSDNLYTAAEVLGSLTELVLHGVEKNELYTISD